MGIVVELTKTIEDMGETVTKLTFREPVFGDILEVDDIQNEMKIVAKIIEKCANITPLAVKQLSLTDIKNITEELHPFLAL